MSFLAREEIPYKMVLHWRGPPQSLAALVTAPLSGEPRRIKLSSEVVALRATLSSALSGHLPSKEGLIGARFARFFMRLRRAPSSGASRHLLPEEGLRF